MTRADEFATTDAERAALAAFREAAGESDGPFELHSLRTFLIADRLAGLRDLQVDRELLYVAGILHDVGIYDRDSKDAYVRDGARLASSLLREHGWGEERIRLCADAIERHHELRSQWDRGAEVELIRRADLVELSAGLIRFGVPREWLRDLFRSIPRRGAYRAVGRQLAHALRQRPLSLPRIFRR